MAEQAQQKEIKVEFPSNLRGGVYCNNMVAPPAGAVTARVIMSPGHMKRTIAALQENLKKYEEKFGKIQEAAEPPKGKIGFHTP